MRTLASLLLCSLTLSAAEPPKGFTPLFNEKDLSGWHGDGGQGNPAALSKLSPDEAKKKQDAWNADAKAHWSVQNGELVNDGHGAFLVTDKKFADFELLIDYKTVARADSGIYLKTTPQVQIWDSTDPAKFKLGADKGSGALWNNPPGDAGKDPLVKADKPFGEWNSFRIVMVGERVSVWLNGQQVVDHARLANYWANQMKPPQKLPLPQAGPILLQTHGGEIRWRNIFIRELPAAEANEFLANSATDGMKPLFDGKTLNGWAGATDSYEVIDGAIVCKPKKGGALYTKDTFDDFVTAFEFKLPPGGNNGLGIRYPGKGDGAYSGMCELQIIDNTADKYKKLDPRQYHGSAYGMAAAQRGYLRPVGAWNFQTVTVKGPTIVVELNGSRILDTDLSKITEYMAKSPHPGKDRKAGHLALLGHNDPVAIRNVMVKPLAK